MDRPLGTAHPKHGFIYTLNYGYIPNTISGDGEELDAYIVGEHMPLQTFTGKVIAIIHRKNDVEDKLVVAPEGLNLSKEEILKAVSFQEKYFETEIFTLI